MGQQLRWGHRYLMVEPNHFRVEYAINPHMDPVSYTHLTLPTILRV